MVNGYKDVKQEVDGSHIKIKIRNMIYHEYSINYYIVQLKYPLNRVVRIFGYIWCLNLYEFKKVSFKLIVVVKAWVKEWFEVF